MSIVAHGPLLLKCAYFVFTINNRMLIRLTKLGILLLVMSVFCCWSWQQNRHVLIKCSVVGRSIFCCDSNRQLALVPCGLPFSKSQEWTFCTPDQDGWHPRLFIAIFSDGWKEFEFVTKHFSIAKCFVFQGPWCDVWSPLPTSWWPSMLGDNALVKALNYKFT